MGKDWRWQIYVGFVANIDIKILGAPHLGLGMPFLDNDTCEGYFCQGFLLCMMPSMDGWMESFTKDDHDVLYYMIYPSVCGQHITVMKITPK
jgi:hypothetical protein